MIQPLNNIQWVDRETLKPNNYNPNKVAPPELKLLKVSILEDGWTQPIVINSDNTIVDGFHRWTVSDDKDVLYFSRKAITISFELKSFFTFFIFFAKLTTFFFTVGVTFAVRPDPCFLPNDRPFSFRLMIS